MVNGIKESADGLALQVTRPARAANLVEENADGDAISLSGVFVYGFDSLLVVLGAKQVADSDRAELVAAATRDTDSIHRGTTATVAEAGNGYQVQLPGCKAAGFSKGDNAPVVPADGVLFIHDGTQRRLVEDLQAIRSEQVSR